MTLTARIESVGGFRGGIASLWLTNGSEGYRVRLPVALAEQLVAQLQPSALDDPPAGRHAQCCARTQAALSATSQESSDKDGTADGRRRAR